MKSREGESNNDESTKQPWNESCELNKMNEIIRISNEMKVKMNLAQKMKKNTPPLIQEPKNKFMEIHHLRKLLKIRTKTREQNSLILKIVQWRISFETKLVFYK